MESVYSKFFNGKPSDFGIGTWNSHPRSINRSASTTCINSSIAPPLPGNLRKRSFYSNETLNESLRMQLLEAKLNNIEQKDKQIKQLNSQVILLWNVIFLNYKAKNNACSLRQEVV